ncbi:MAG: hypothetical protein KAR39_02565 [Thermoplasmata archaeon]|nr:hypothetical protein [Thermoplasmata archaeon]
MDADRLRAARDRGVVTTDISSRGQMVTTDISSREQMATPIKNEGSAWARLLRIKRPK